MTRIDRAISSKHRIGWLAASIAFVLMLGLVTRAAAPVNAQDATPAPLGFELAPGVTAGDVASPDAPALFRLQLAGGVSYDANDGNDPTIVLIYGETGTLSFTTSVPVTIFRADAVGKPGEAIAAGTAFNVNPGDFLAGPGNSKTVITNNGTAPATLLVATLMPPTAGASATPTS